MEIEYEPYPGDASTDLTPQENMRPTRSAGFTIFLSALIVIGVSVGVSVTVIGPIIVGLCLILIAPILGIMFLIKRYRSSNQEFLTGEPLTAAQNAAATFATFSQGITLISSIALLAVGLGTLLAWADTTAFEALFGDGFLYFLFMLPTVGAIALIAGIVWYYNTNILIGEQTALRKKTGKPGLIQITRILSMINICGYTVAVIVTVIFWIIQR